MKTACQRSRSTTAGCAGYRLEASMGFCAAHVRVPDLSDTAEAHLFAQLTEMRPSLATGTRNDRRKSQISLKPS